MTPEQKTAIQQDAERAAQMKWTPNQMCPHPFSSEQGKHWVACYWAMWERLRGASHHHEASDWGDEHQQERRGK